MKRAPIVCAGLFALFPMTTSLAATGTVSLSWNGCGAPLTSAVTASPGQTSGLALTAFVEGQSDPTIAYFVRVLYGDASLAVPDAWRFDAGGCQGSAFVRLNHLAPAAIATSCPSFQDAGGRQSQTLQIKDISFAPPGVGPAPTLLRITVADDYPIGAGNAPTAGTRYFLMDAEFDQTFGVNGATPPDQSACGGLQDGICFQLNSATYIAPGGGATELPFHLSSTGFASVNGSCPGASPTPVRPRSWGAVKSQYRQ